MHDRDQARLAAGLGYTQYQTYADTGEMGSVPLTQCILTEQPFTVAGKHLIISEIVQDQRGRAKVARDGVTFRIRAKMPALRP